jgi:hypothetical protein
MKRYPTDTVVETILDEFLKLNNLEDKPIKDIWNDMYVKGGEAFQYPKRKT